MGLLDKISSLKSATSMQLCHSVHRTPIECDGFLNEREGHILCTLITATKNVQFSKAEHTPDFQQWNAVVTHLVLNIVYDSQTTFSHLISKK